ncbi:ATP-binding protein [Peribacillus glennii]|nr:ATP-binding protein [Peribacillus glennii]
MKLYIGIVIIPLLIFTAVYMTYLDRAASLSLKKKSEWVGSVHHEYLDKVLKETKNNLEILALSGSSLQNDKEKSKDLLARAKSTDPRYAGMFLLDRKGYSIAGTNDMFLHMPLMDGSDIRTSIITRKPIISEKRMDGKGTFSYFTISSPILNERNNVTGFLLAQVRIDYMENVMAILTPDYKVEVVNKQRFSILRVNHENNGDINEGKWITIPADEVSWSIRVKMPPKKESMDYRSVMIGTVFGLIVTHIIFLTIKYLLLRREAKKQTQLFEAQKIEVIGTLAASTAHEIKNPLTGIKGLMQLLQEKYTDGDDQFYFSVIMKEIERINNIVSEFLVLGKPIAQKLDVLDIRQVVTDLQPILESEAKLYNCQMAVHLPDEPIMVRCSSHQMKQVVLNVAKNGFEAMPDRGKLSIKITAESKRAVITITDTGFGISQEGLKNVFQPFYSSKQSGTGLGLYVCRRILSQFQGSIELSSKKGSGTQAVIQLPLANAG